MGTGKRFLNGTLTGYSPATLAVMKEAYAKGWSLISHRYRGEESVEDARLRPAEAIVAVTPANATDADAIVRMAIDLVNIEERDFRPL